MCVKSLTHDMLSADETYRIQLKAIEQAMQAAGIAKTDPTPLLPVVEPWPFPLTRDDVAFLKINKISSV